MTTNRTTTWRAALATIALCGAACSGTEDGGSPPPASDPTPTEADGAAVRDWADALIGTMSDHESSLRGLGRELSPQNSDPREAREALQGQAEALDALADALPDQTGIDEALAGRYAAFRSALDEVVLTSQAIAANPDESAPWAYGDASAAFTDSRDAWLDECFNLQSALTERDLGVLGCVGLTGVEDPAWTLLEQTAFAGIGVLNSTIRIDLERTTTPGGHDPHIIFNETPCQPEDEQPKLDDIERYAAGIATLSIDEPQGNAAVTVWAFADAATADIHAKILDRLLRTRRECIHITTRGTQTPEGVFIDTQDADAIEFSIDFGSGFQIMAFAEPGPPVTFQVATAKQGNVIALFSLATNGEPWEERDIREIVSNARVGGGR